MTTVAGTTPYPWPYDGVVDPEVTALVVTGGGPIWARFVAPDEAAMSNVTVLRERLAAVGVLVVVVDHRPPVPHMEHALDPGTALVAANGELAVTAAGLDGFYGSALDATLQRHRRTHLLLCGNGLETTVHGTLRRANDRGYECLTVIDAAAAHDPSLVAASRSSIEMSGGIFGAVGTTTAVIEAYTSTPPSSRDAAADRSTTAGHETHDHH